MFTDIVGYTAMMQRGERDAVAAIRHHQKVLDANVARFGGKLLQYYVANLIRSSTE